MLTKYEEYYCAIRYAGWDKFGYAKYVMVPKVGGDYFWSILLQWVWKAEPAEA